MSIEQLSKFIEYIFGEALGDKILLGSFSAAPKKSAREKRYEIFVPLASIGFSITSATGCALVACLLSLVPLDFIPACAEDLAGGLTCISVFTSGYMIARKAGLQKVIDLGTPFIDSHDGFLQMYVPIGSRGEYQLSKRWHFIKHSVMTLLLFNCILQIGRAHV